jgi:hypothetical protein
METHSWLGFENEEHEGTAGRAEYSDFDQQSELSPEDEREHAEYVRRVAAEHGFPLSNWQPTIPSRATK